MNAICKRKPVWVVLGAILLLGSSAYTAENGVGVRRFALLAGANYGGLDRVTLRFAESDAQAVHGVLTELGGVRDGDQLLLTDPTPEELGKAFASMDKRLAAAARSGQRLEFVFYYSGHSDESGLLLGGKLFSYRDVRATIKKLPANVKVAILDSCASGAFTRTKGGVRRQPFLVDTSTMVRGLAVLTSSSATETAQESDRVGGSFFTHYLVSGLRGAADISRDGKVTLAEAYQYAFNETLARTETTQKGAQHPNYDFQLQGSGDLILTDLRGTSAVLELGSEVRGRLFIRDTRGNLVAEVNKPTDVPMRIGLEPGVYRITLEVPNQLRRGTVEVSEGEPTRLNVAQLEVVEAEVTRARGDDRPEAVIEMNHVPFSFSVFPGLDTNPNTEMPVLNRFSFNLFVGWGYALRGGEISGFGGIREGPVSGVQFAGLFNSAGEVRGVQVGGIFNMTTGPVHGIMGAGVANFTRFDVHGAQLASSFNYARSVTGVQAGVINAIENDLHGVQASVVGYTGDLTGVQASVVGVSTGEARGLQAGVVNYANKAHKALQIGVINIAQEMGDSGVPIGLINVIGDGILSPSVWVTDTTPINVGIKMGSRRFYTIMGAGVLADDKDSFFPIAGFGGRFWLIESLWLDLDLIGTGPQWRYREDPVDILSKVRATIGWQIASHFAIYTGVSLNFLVSENRCHGGPAALRLGSWKTDDLFFDLGLGLVAGVAM